MNIQQALAKLLENESLDSQQMHDTMYQVMTGEATPAQIGALLAALRMKGETVDEVAAAAAVMRELATKVEVDVDKAIDIVGTGGDASSTFNVSTCSAFVTSAAGVPIAKHGNRSISSKSGAADFLEAAGINIDLNAEQIARCVNEVGIGFMFAPNHHSAMKHAVGPRRELAARTIFNLLGPLTNPAGVKRQLMGVFDKNWVEPLAHVLQKLGSTQVMVVHGHNNMDELSISGPSVVAELKDGKVESYAIDPTTYGLSEAPLSAIQVEGAEQSRALIEDVLANKPGAARDIVLLNAGAAIYIGGAADSIEQGVDKARGVLEDGSAAKKLTALATFSQELNNGA